MGRKTIIKTLLILTIMEFGLIFGQTVGNIAFALGAAASTAVVAGIMAALAIATTGLSILNHLAPPTAPTHDATK